MIIKSAEFIKSAVKKSQYPDALLPEIAFTGRSNVGKSSLINTLVNRKKLVKTGSTPGRTRLINFFNINESFIFTDLPGYGYAKVPRMVKKTWEKMITSYLLTRETLKGAVFIVDIRRTPDEKDKNLSFWFDHFNISKIIVLTKADKLSKTKQQKQCVAIAKSFFVKTNDTIIFSAKSRQGKDDVWRAIEMLIE